MKNWKLILLAVGVVLVAALIVQNTDEVVTRLLFFEVSMPRAVWLLASFAIGVAAGILIALRFSRTGKARTKAA